MKERLDRIIDVGTSLAGQDPFRELIRAGDWSGAMAIMEQVPSNFPYIDRISLFNTEGILMDSIPLNDEVSAVIGNDFSYRDYYLGTIENWEPYVAETIKPAVPLGYNLVPVAIPIKSESDEPLGIMLLVINLDTIAEWSESINVGSEGFIYIVDARGHLIAHPTLLPAEEVIDFSSEPEVKSLINGESGVDVFLNEDDNEKRVIAYESVPSYGWGIAVIQPTRAAFAERNSAVTRMVIL